MSRHRVFLDVEGYTSAVTAQRLDDDDAGSRVRVTVTHLAGDLILDLPADVADALAEAIVDAAAVPLP